LLNLGPKRGVRRKPPLPASYPRTETVTDGTVLITVRLFAVLRIGRFAAMSWKVPPGTSIATILEEVSIPQNQVGMLTVNHLRASPGQQLREGDILSVFPSVEAWESPQA